MDDWESLATSGQTLVTTNEVTEAKDIEAKKDVHVPQTQAPNPKKEAKKNKNKDYDKKWEEQNPHAANKGPLTAKEREEISKQSDQANSVELFGDFVDKNALNDLNTEKAVIDFARKVSGVLVKEGRKKHIQEFVKEILGSVSTVLTSLEYDEIANKSKVLFNQKQKEEKAAESKSTKKKSKKEKKKKSNQPSVKMTATQRAKAEFGFADDYDSEDDQYDDNNDFM